MLKFIFLVLMCAWGLFEEIPQIKSITSTEMVVEIENPDYMVMVLIYDENGQGSIALSNVLRELMPKFSNYVKVLALDCISNPTMCKEDIIPKLPIFQGYVPAGLNPYTGKPLIHERPYQGVIAVKEIGDFFNNHIPYLGEFLTPDNNENFVTEENNKVVLFTNKDKVPIIFKGLSSKYRGRLEFGTVFHNQTDLLKYYDQFEFPSLIVMEEGDIIRYPGKIDFNDISAFLDKYASAVKKPQKPKKIVQPKPQPQEEQKLPEFPIITLTTENINDYLQEDTGLYLVHFYKEKSSAEWEDIKQDYNGIVKLATFHCKTKEEQESCANAGVKKYPSIRVFPVNRKRKSFELSFNSRSDLEEEISRELRFDVTTLQEATVQTFLSAIREEPRVACLLIAEGPMPLQFKGLASENSFRDFVKFAYFNRPKEQALSIFTIKTYPAIIAFAKGESEENMQVIEYNGKFDDYPSLYYFIDQVAIPMFLKKQPKISEEEQEEIDIVRDSHGFHTKCLRKSGICVVGLFEGEVRIR